MKKVLVTGGTGYVGSWVTRFLLEAGYDVQLAGRNPNNSKKYAALKEIAQRSNGNLTVWEADLLQEGSYDQPMKGCEVVFHIASPFSIKVKDPKRDLLDPALNGTNNVLQSVNKTDSVKRVVLTSSVAAIYGDNADMRDQGLEQFDEQYYNTTSSLMHQPYSFSKVCAEQSAWKINKEQKRWSMVVINPGLVWGPVIHKHSQSESITLMNDILRGKFAFGVPSLNFGCVDVRDVARAHLLAAENNTLQGRHILVNETLSMFQLTKIAARLFGARFKFPRSETPKWIMIAIGPVFGVTRKFIRRNVGYPIAFSNEKSKKEMGIEYTPIVSTIEDMINSLM